MIKIITYSAGSGEGKYWVEAVAIPCGKDVSVTICGGTDHHIGATAISVPRPSLDDPARLSSSTSVICVTGHKDDELARMAAGALASSLDCIVTVSAGIHIDNATEEDINKLKLNFSLVLDQLKIILKTHYKK